jgi:hypothetical protein
MLQKKCLEEKEEKGGEDVGKASKKQEKGRGGEIYIHWLKKPTHSQMCIYKNDRLN